MGEPILSIAPPEIEGSPYQLSGTFCNDSGSIILRIINNELQELIDNWDVEIVGAKLTIRHRYRGIALKLHFVPPNKIEIVQMNMYYKGSFIQGNKQNGFYYISPDGSIIAFDRKGVFRSCDTGIEILDSGIHFGINCQGGGRVY